MFVTPAPMMQRTSPTFLEVPKAIPHRRRSASRSRDPDAPRTRSRSRSNSLTSITPILTGIKPLSPLTAYQPSAPSTVYEVSSESKAQRNSMSPSRASRKRLSGDSYQRPHGSPPPPLRHTRPSTPPPEQGSNYELASMHASEIFRDMHSDYYTLPPSPSPSPPLQTPLKEKLVGAWRLESYVAYPTATSPMQRPKFPMTKNVTGLIMYTPDGYMSAQMLIPGQSPFDKGAGDDQQWAEAGKRCFAYAGPYYITNEGRGREEVLRHTFQFCSLPGWIGDIQVRTWQFEEDGDVLVLGSEEPTQIQGDFRIPILKWRRCRNNMNAQPPPPVPQIKISGPGEW